MALLRVDARPLVPRLRSELAALLTSLTGADWAQPTFCPGWSVHDVAAHLLGGELGNIWYVVRAAARWELAPAPRAQPAACQARTTVGGALRLYARDPSAPPLNW